MIPIDKEILNKQFDKFSRYVCSLNNSNSELSFIDHNSVLAKEEGYKSSIPRQARDVLKIEEWDESWIGSGKIRDRVVKVMNLSSNLVNYNSIIVFCKHFESDKAEYDPDSERVIYEIYKGNDDQFAFEHAIRVFGAKYPVLAYLFFVKDETKYLPTSPENFDRAFKELGIDFKMSYKCSWNNYCQFIELIREIGKLMTEHLEISHDVSLLDAHSFVWIAGEEKYINWHDGMSDINSPMYPKNVIEEGTGLIKYQCPHCDYFFKKAKRCPECGQAIKE